MLTMLANLNEMIFIIPLIIICVILIIAVVRLNKKLGRLTAKYERFMRGKNAENLDEAIAENFAKVEHLSLTHQQSMLKMEETMQSINSTYQKTGIVKYNAFKEMGGNLSFALALLDNNNSGFIITSMHGRESCYTYIKEVLNGQCYTALGDEEQEALAKAMDTAIVK